MVQIKPISMQKYKSPVFYFILKFYIPTSKNNTPVLAFPYITYT